MSLTTANTMTKHHRPLAKSLAAVSLTSLLAIGGFFAYSQLHASSPEEASQTTTAEAPAMPATSVRVVAVEEGLATERRRVTGTLQAARRAEVAAREAGAVETILVREGERVQAGQVLARLDARRLEAELTQTRAALDSARALIAQREAELARAETDFAMHQRLLARQAVSESEFLDAQAAFAVAEAQTSAARTTLGELEAQLVHLQVRRADLQVRAPFTGQVVAQPVELGEWLNPGQAVMTVVSTHELEAWLTIPERYAAALQRPDTTVAVEIPATGDTLQVPTSRLVQDVDPRARTFPLVIELENDGRWAPGMSLTATVPTQVPTAQLLVPHDAVLRGPQGDFVYRATPQGGGYAAERVPVEVLLDTGDALAIRGAGLSRADYVVIEGNERLQPAVPLALEIEDFAPETSRPLVLANVATAAR